MKSLMHCTHNISDTAVFHKAAGQEPKKNRLPKNKKAKQQPEGYHQQHIVVDVDTSRHINYEDHVAACVAED